MTRGTWMLTVLSLALILPSLAAAADPPPAKTDAAKTDSGKQETSRSRYARVYLALAKLDVQIAQDRNKQFPDTLPPAIMLVLEQRVALAEQWMKEAQGDGSKPGEMAVKIAEIYLKMAEANYAKAQQVNRISPMRPRALERVRLKLELAQAALATAKELDPSSLDSFLQFEIDRLREEVSELHVRQVEILDRN